MEKKLIKVSELKPHPKNPKLHVDDKIAESITEFGYIEPIVVDENNQILAGHGRLKALKKLGTENIEVIVKRGLTEKQKEKYLLLSNKLVELGSWDFDLLKNFDEDILKGSYFQDFEILFLKDKDKLSDITNEYSDMPEFIAKDKDCVKHLIIKFKSLKDYNKFIELNNIEISERDKSIYYPFTKKTNYKRTKYNCES